MYNPLNLEDLEKLKQNEQERFKFCDNKANYINLQGLDLKSIDGIDVEKFDELARIMRGFIFTMLEASHSGHPGGSSGKVEQFLAMVLGGQMSFDALKPKDTGRDRVVWSAGHCSPGLYAGLTLIYETLKGQGKDFDAKKIEAVLAKDLLEFRQINGPQGHIENYSPLSDVATGPSGHGISAAGGLAITYKSCGLPFKTWVFMGDAESEEGMTYESRNLMAKVGMSNMIVSLSYNHFGIDGAIEEVIDTPYQNHWLGLGWNTIEVDGHNIKELVYAYKLAAQGFENGRPTVVLAHTIKGKHYGKNENSNKSHGAPADHDEYVEIMKKLGFDIAGIEGEVRNDIKIVLESLTDDLQKYLSGRLEIIKNNIKPEKELVEVMKKSLSGRELVNPRDIKRPENLPEELKFAPGDKKATRKAAAAWFKWIMKETPFLYAGSGDLAGSIKTSDAEDVYGVITRDNPFGRGIRFGIAEQNMAMMSTALTQDRLPGNFQPISTFGTYAVFTSMVCDAVRLSLIGNHLKPDTAGFFVMLAAHDGPETGEDGPTHQGLYWMSMYTAYPGIKVYKPMDAAETIEMLFYALEKGEPIALSLMRPDTEVLDRKWGSNPRDAINGAYIYKNYEDNGKVKKCLVISGAQTLLNTLEILDSIEKDFDVKIVNVTSPQLFEELEKEDSKKAEEIYSVEDRKVATMIHNGWKGFLYPFLLPENHIDKTIAIDTYLKSGKAPAVYELAGMSPEGIKKQVLKSFK